MSKGIKCMVDRLCAAGREALGHIGARSMGWPPLSPVRVRVEPLARRDR